MIDKHYSLKCYKISFLLNGVWDRPTQIIITKHQIVTYKKYDDVCPKIYVIIKTQRYWSDSDNNEVDIREKNGFIPVKNYNGKMYIKRVIQNTLLLIKSCQYIICHCIHVWIVCCILCIWAWSRIVGHMTKTKKIAKPLLKRLNIYEFLFKTNQRMENVNIFYKNTRK